MVDWKFSGSRGNYRSFNGIKYLRGYQFWNRKEAEQKAKLLKERYGYKVRIIREKTHDVHGKAINNVLYVRE